MYRTSSVLPIQTVYLLREVMIRRKIVNRFTFTGRTQFSTFDKKIDALVNNKLKPSTRYTKIIKIPSKNVISNLLDPPHSPSTYQPFANFQRSMTFLKLTVEEPLQKAKTCICSLKFWHSAQHLLHHTMNSSQVLREVDYIWQVQALNGNMKITNKDIILPKLKS